MSSEVIIQSASLIVYALILVFSVLVFIEAARAECEPSMRLVAQSLMLMTFAMAAVFSTLQVLYILNRSWAGLPPAEVSGWIAHDWANGLTHLAFVLATRVLLHQSHAHAAAPPPCQTGACPGKITLKKTTDMDRDLAAIRRELEERAKCL